MALKSVLPWAYLVLALTFSLLAARITPPFMPPDEVTHFSRSDMLTYGYATRRDPGPHGAATLLLLRTHSSIYEAAAAYERVKFHPWEKVTASDHAVASAPRFDARLGYASPGAAMNPALYGPSAVAVGIGRHFGWPILSALFLGRVLTALVCAGLGFLALLRAGRARLPIFAILMLPMCQSLFGAVSQDGPVIALTALAIAELSRAMDEGRPLRPREWGLAVVCLTLVAVAKAPYVVFLLLLLAAPCARRAWAVAAVLAGAAAALGWAVWTSVDGWAALPPAGMNADAPGQAAGLLHQPAAVFAVATQTLQARGGGWAHQFIGVLGYLDTALPDWFYWTAYGMLALAFLAAAGVGLARAWTPFRWLAPAVVLISFAAVAGALYLTWTPVGAPVVEGVQGRYLLPIGLVLTLLTTGSRPALAGAGGRVREGVAWAVLAFPVVSLLVVLSTLVQRYYGV